MFGRSGVVFVALILALLLAVAFAQDAPKVQRVTFKDGRATIRGSIKGYQVIDYVFPAGAEESIKVGLNTKALSNYFNLIAPGATEAMYDGSTGEPFSGIAPRSGDYTARVYMMRNAARRGLTANYTLSIAVGQNSATNEKGPDYADGLTGGPDYWEVTGVGPGDGLSMRQTPSPKGKLVMQFLNGTVLKNLGCKNARGQRWCHVEQPGEARQGWVNGRYLREGSGPTAATPQR
jgi:hypothetical protein